MACGDSLLTVALSPSLSGGQGFYRDYVPVFLKIINGNGLKLIIGVLVIIRGRLG